MNFTLWVAAGTLLAAAQGAQAAQSSPSSRTADPADPAAAVPPAVHASALKAYIPAPKDGQTPDKAWRAANDALSAQPAHGGHHAPARDEKPQSAAPAAPAASHAPHQHH